MLSVKRFYGEWLSESYYNFFDLLSTNLFWAFFTALVITAPAAAAGLYYTTNQLAHQKSISWRTFFEGFRQLFWLGWRWALMNLVVVVLLYVNIVFYGQFHTQWADFVQGLFITLSVFWAIVQVFTFPLLIEQHDRRLRVALRNSLVVIMRRLGFVIGLLLVMIVLILISTFLLWPLWFLITASLLAYLANLGTVAVVQDLAEAQAGVAEKKEE
jgi:uncharacterized membrane protein YesL